MKCERCGEREARIRYTEVRDGAVEKRKICDRCAQELGFDASPEELLSEPAQVVAADEEVPDPEDLEIDARRCPGCGITGAELRNQHLLGCPACYEAFADRLDTVLRKLHGAGLHRGRLPGGRTAVPPDPEDLQKRIDDAIEAEDFESAARLRDRLRRTRGGGS